MIPENEWRVCCAPGCGHLIKPSRDKETPREYALKKYCSRECWNAHRPLKEIVPKTCSNPGCDALVPIMPGDKPNVYARRKCCSPECVARSARKRAVDNNLARHFLKAPGPQAEPKPKAKRIVVKLKPIARADEAEAIAAFIAQRGITQCPPRYAAPTRNAALPEREAKQVIRRLQIADNRYASWAWRPQT